MSDDTDDGRPRGAGNRSGPGGPRKPFRKNPSGGERGRAGPGVSGRDAGPGGGGRRPFRKPDGESAGPGRAPRERTGEKRADGKRSGDKRFGDRPFGGKRPGEAQTGNDRFRPGRPFGERPQRGRDDRPERDARPERSGGRTGEEGRFRPRFDRERAPPAIDRDEERPSSGRSGADEPERIAKVMARAGLCSRRDAEDWILAGRVSVNGAVIDSPALDVGPKDTILIDGAPLPTRERTRLWLYHKPAGLVTTADDPEGRPTVFDHLPEGLPRVISVGRLDINTEGLLLLTNDGGLARVLAHPSTAWLRRYRVRAHGSVTQARLDELRDGITIDGVDYEPVVATLERERGDNVWLVLDLREGKNREVKIVLEHLGLIVNRLIRVSFGPFQLGDLPEGTVEEIRSRMLKDQLGERLAAEAGVDFDGPRFDHARQATRPAQSPRRFEENRPPPGRGRRDDRGDARPGFRKERNSADSDTRFGRDRPVQPRRDHDEKPRRPEPEPLRAGERAGNPHVFRADQGSERPRYKRLDKEGFAKRRQVATTGEDAGLRLERGQTADRRGRPVAVERIVSERPLEPERPRRREWSDRPRGDKPFRARLDGGDRTDRPFRKRFDGEERPSRSDGDRPSRPPRAEGDRPYRAKSDDGARPFRKGPPKFGSKPGDERAKKPFKAGDGRRAKPGPDRPPRQGPSRGIRGEDRRR